MKYFKQKRIQFYKILLNNLIENNVKSIYPELTPKVDQVLFGNFDNFFSKVS